MKYNLHCIVRSTLAGTCHLRILSTAQGGVGTTPPCRFVPDWARASRNFERVARRETMRLVYELKDLGQRETSEVRSSTEKCRNRDRRYNVLLMEPEQNFDAQRVPCDE